MPLEIIGVSILECLLRSIFGKIKMAVEMKNGRKLPSRWQQKTIPTSKRHFPQNEAQSGAERFKMLQNRGLEGCCAALGGLLGHLGVGGASGEAS